MKYLRPDITHALIHLTSRRAANGLSAEKALHSILIEGKIKGSGNSGFVKGENTASCFTDMPLSSLNSFIEDHSGEHKYEKFGIAMPKQSAFRIGARPVIYLPNLEAKWIPDDEKWRHVQFDHGSVDFTHEREWRCKGDFDISNIPIYVIVPRKKHEDSIKGIEKPLGAKNIKGFLHMETIIDIL